MARRKKPLRKKTYRQVNFLPIFSGLVFVVLAGVLSWFHLIRTDGLQLQAIVMELDPNLGLKQQVEEFFTANDAPEMISIIKCESRFRHFNADGSILMNKTGSSATGIAQILSSAHPDPKVVKRYNQVHNTELRPEDLDITTLEGNLGYALMLYEVNGTKDWECSKKFRFSS